MNTNIIDECKSLSLAGQITFPEVVKRLSAIGVERYIADLVGLRIHYYNVNGELYTLGLKVDPYSVAEKFDVGGVKNAVTDIQQQRINYRTFLHRIVEAGCSHYEVFITGKKVVYCGRDGTQHVELFPGVQS